MTAETLRRIAPLALAGLLVAAGCDGGDDGGTTDGGGPDAGADAVGPPDAGPDGAGPGPDGAGPGPDGAGDGAAAPDGDTGGGGPKTVAPKAEPEPLEVDSWRTAYLGQRNDDPVRPKVVDGSFEFPEPGRTEEDVQWQAQGPDDEGTFDEPYPRTVFYAVARIVVEEPTNVILHANAFGDVYSGDTHLPGDLYNTSSRPIPLRLEAGANLVVMRGRGRNEKPSVTFQRTPDEVWMNRGDLTTPDLLIGQSEPQYVGVPVLNFRGEALVDVTARVVESDLVEGRTRSYPAIGPETVSQIAFEVMPKEAMDEPGATVPVTVRLESPTLAHHYERTVELTAVADDPGASTNDDPASKNPIIRTFISPVDGSAQAYALNRPPEPEGDEQAGILTLHGAGVGLPGNGNAYHPKDWAYVIAPTNRRPFGFDWEYWGRRNAIATLEDAMSRYPIDERDLHVTGHSMGGHGTWQLGVLYPDKFGLVAPSAGWNSFKDYPNICVGQEPDTFSDNPFGWAKRSSETKKFVENLAGKPVHVIHAINDDNVCIEQAEMMIEAVQPHTDALEKHFEDSNEHWWDGDASEGADCVDWPPLMERIQSHTVDPHRLEFRYTTPSPRVRAEHSYVTVRAREGADGPAVLESTVTEDGSTVELTTDNVYSMVLDGAVLEEKGISTVVVDGEEHEVSGEDMPIGPQSGKRPGVSGPVSTVFMRPFCLVYPDDGPSAYRSYASYLLANWQMLGNGYGCALPRSEVTEELRSSRNMVYLGLGEEYVAPKDSIPFSWTGKQVTFRGQSFQDVAATFAFPEGDHLGAVFTATQGAESLLFRLQPFTSRFVIPDYMMLSSQGASAVGFWGPEWGYVDTLGVP